MDPTSRYSNGWSLQENQRNPENVQYNYSPTPSTHTHTQVCNNQEENILLNKVLFDTCKLADAHTHTHCLRRLVCYVQQTQEKSPLSMSCYKTTQGVISDQHQLSGAGIPLSWLACRCTHGDSNFTLTTTRWWPNQHQASQQQHRPASCKKNAHTNHAQHNFLM